jgi:hypothetical protein
MATPEVSAAPEAETSDTSTTSESALFGDASIVKENGEECPICQYIKEGPCRDEFVAFNACAESLRPDEPGDKCTDTFTAMFNCFEKNIDHYGPIIQLLGSLAADSSQNAESSESS